jgi:membrane protease YdiL (CAAX protease family)
LDEITTEASANIEPTSEVPSVSRPRIWTVFAVPLAGLILAVGFQIVIVVSLLVLGAAQGRSIDDVAQELPRSLSTPSLFMLLAGSGQLAFATVTLIAVWLSPTPARQRLGLYPAKQSWTIYPLSVFGSIAVLAIGVCFAIALTWIIPADAMVEELFKDMTPQAAVPFVLFIAIFPGVIEELLFRGYVQRRLLERWRPVTAIFVSSLLFALVHMQPHHVVLAFPLGIWFGVIAWRTGSVYPSMLCHAFVNGGLNAWRMVVKFGEVPEITQNVVNIGAILLGSICLILAINMLIGEQDTTTSLATT